MYRVPYSMGQLAIEVQWAESEHRPGFRGRGKAAKGEVFQAKWSTDKRLVAS